MFNCCVIMAFPCYHALFRRINCCSMITAQVMLYLATVGLWWKHQYLWLNSIQLNLFNLYMNVSMFQLSKGVLGAQKEFLEKPWREIWVLACWRHRTQLCGWRRRVLTPSFVSRKRCRSKGEAVNLVDERTNNLICLSAKLLLGRWDRGIVYSG
jgi:hypothetical protein